MMWFSCKTGGSLPIALASASAMGICVACSFQDFSSLQEGETSKDTETGGKDNSDNTGGESSGGESTGGTSGQGASPGSGSGDGSGGTGAETGGDGDGDMTPMGGMGGMGPDEILLQNASFETGNTLDWDVEPSSALGYRYIYVQAPTGNVPAPDGNYELAFWHETDSYEVTISQRLEGLRDGTYSLSGHFSRGANLVVHMFAKGCSDEDPEPREIPITDPNSFTVYKLEGIEVSGGSCEVGLTVQGGPNDWMNVDLLRFGKE